MSSTAAVPVAVKPNRKIVAIQNTGSTSPGTPSSFQTGISSSSITTIMADAVVEEKHEDQMVITQHPVEQGSTIADHAYKLPARLELTYAWSAGSTQNTSPNTGDPLAFLKGIYQQLLAIMVSATICTVFTGKRVYDFLLIKSLATNSDKENENSMTVHVELEEVLFATTQIVPLTSASVQALPQNTAPTVNTGNSQLQPAPNYNFTATP